MNDKKIIIAMVVSTIVILFGAILLVGQSPAAVAPQISASQNAKVSAGNTTFDWGNINYSGGYATKSFTIKNTGTDTLKLFNIKTSCHCTNAHITINGTDSPDFGMSGVSSWVGEVAPGKEAKLTVVFDPAYHGPQGVGPITRYTSVETNDSSNPKLTFTTSGIVVNK